MKALLLTAMVISLPQVEMNDFIYHEDPCVEALRAAMESMESFIPEHFTKTGNFWVDQMQLTDEGMREREFAGEVWKDAKLMCWRH